MSSGLDAVLRYGFGRDSAALSAFASFVQALVGRARPREPEDIGQTILLKLAVSPEKAVLLVRTLAKRNAGLAAALDTTPLGAVPILSPQVLAEANRQLEAYVSEMVRNAEVDRLRRERRIVPFAEPELIPGAPAQHDDASGVFELRDRILEEVGREEQRPGWLDEAVGEIQALAEGERTMDELTVACISTDPELQAAPPEAARVRARNRLQQRHRRAREHLLGTMRSLVSVGALTADEGRAAEKWLGMLKRRQNRARSPSSRVANA